MDGNAIKSQDGAARIWDANSAQGFEGLEKTCAIDVPELVFLAMGRKFGLSNEVPAGNRRSSAL